MHMKRGVAAYRKVPEHALEDLAVNHTLGFLMAAKSVDEMLARLADTQENKRQLISSVSITDEKTVTELMALDTFTLKNALTRITSAATANGGEDTTPCKVPVGPKGSLYADKAKSTTPAKTPKGDIATPYADKVKGCTEAPKGACADTAGAPVPEVILARRIEALEKAVSGMETTIQEIKAALEAATKSGEGPLLRKIDECVAALEQGTKERTSPVSLTAPVAALEGKEWADDGK
jgi:hypothetical protein